MVTIEFANEATMKKALGFLLGRFSGKVLRSGEIIVPDDALAALADQNIAFMVKGRTTYEEHIAALRSTAAATVQ